MAAGNAHRVLSTMFDAFTAGVGPGIGNDPGSAGTIRPTLWGQVFPVVTAGAEARTLAQPTRAGVQTTIVLSEDSGDLTLTVTGGYNNDDDTSIVFGDAGDFVTFVSIQEGTSYFWRAIAQEGTTAAIEEGVFDTLTATTLTATTLKLAVTAVAAAGSAQGEGGNLLAGLNVVSAADNTKCVDLPTAVAGMVVIVASATAAKTLPIFPATSASIDNAATNAAITLAAATAYTSAVLVADNATHWLSVLGDSA